MQIAGFIVSYCVIFHILDIPVSDLSHSYDFLTSLHDVYLINLITVYYTRGF